MLKIITVLATTFLFAGLLIAHPYTSPSVDPAGATVKVATAAPAQEQAGQQAGQQADQGAAEPPPVAIKTVAPQDQRVAPVGGAADASVAAQAQIEQARLQLPRLPQDSRYVAVNAGVARQQTSAPVPARPQPAAPSFGPTAGYGPATGYGHLSTVPHRDGRHWSQTADATANRINPPPATQSIRIVYNRPMPLEQRIHLEHNNRYYRQ